MSEFTFQTLRTHVLTYADRKRLIKSIEEIDFRIKTKFLLLLGMHGIIPKREPVSLIVTIAKYWELFLDWYFFEREVRGKRTIAELYVESEDFKKDFPSTSVKEADIAVRKLKNPLWSYFVVCGKGEKDEYEVKQLEEEIVYRVHDASTFPNVNEGNVIFAKLYPFGDVWYVSEFIIRYPEETIEKYEQVKAAKDRLDGLFDDFMATKKVKRKTAQKYEEMYFMLSEYVTEKGYTSMKWVNRFNVDTWAKWIRRQWGVSRYKEDECRSAIKQFLKFLKDKE